VGGFFFEEEVQPPAEALVGKKLTPGESAEAARRAYQVLEGLAEMTHASVEPPLRALAEELGISAGQLFGILRPAITGRTVSPPLIESMAVIGKQKVLRRIRAAIEALEGE
jgi:glutamyl-tRNA synthetase